MNKSQLFKKVGIGLVAMMFFSTIQTIAAEPPSNWAIDDLCDAEAYGILPSDFMEVLHTPITEVQLGIILRQVDEELSELGLHSTQRSLPERVGPNTKEMIVLKLYDVLKKYDIADKMQIPQEYIVAYMREKGILQGELFSEEICTNQEVAVLASRLIEDVYNTFNKGAKGLVWEVTDENNTVYLLGSIHINDGRLYPINEDLLEKVEKVDKVAFEIDFLDQTGIDYFIQLQQYQDGTTLDQVVPKELYEKVKAVCAKQGLTEDTIKVIKPWALANAINALAINSDNTVETILDTYPTPILDVYMYNKAMIDEKQIVEIEGYQFQGDLFDQMPMEVQLAQLEMAVKVNQEISSDEETTNHNLDRINIWIDAWMNGDTDTFINTYDKDQKTGIEEIDQFNESLFGQRDVHMAEQVIKYLQDPENTDYMVVVGAGHMIGKDGIINRLEKAGYTIKQVK